MLRLFLLLSAKYSTAPACNIDYEYPIRQHEKVYLVKKVKNEDMLEISISN